MQVIKGYALDVLHYLVDRQVLAFDKLVLVQGLSLSACAPAVPATQPVVAAPATEVPTEAPVTLKIAVLPIIDTLPMYVAQQEGLFARYGVNVEFVPVASAPERDQLLAAGQADGAVNETLSVML
ncbi:MAG: ABC transporter substrate-binding protein, partial [Actinobacteria bacterium]|nr:ABC transporter substrate-binding protein [Actinomycetota bacterium]